LPYYLGIDGGGTKTTCAVGDENHLVAMATAGPSNVVRVGEVKARESLQQAVRQACGGGVVSCRFAYVYPDGPAPYYSVFAPGRPGRELEQWDEIKFAAAEAIAALGGTITHHHAVGRDHRRWYLREVPQLFAGALRGAKAELDPAGIMNPGVLLEPSGAVTYSREGGR